MILIKNNLFPLLKKNLKIFSSIFLICMLSFMLISLSIGIEASLESSLNEYVSEYSYQDLTISTNDMELGDISLISGIPGISEVNFGYTASLTFTKDNQSVFSGRLYTVKSGDFLKIDNYPEETDRSSGLKVYIDSHFAESNSISAGDTLLLSLDGINAEATVSGLVNSPESFGLSQNEFAFFDNTSYCCIYADYSAFTGAFGIEGLYNRATILLQDKSSVKDCTAEIEKALGKDKLRNIETYDESGIKNEIDLITTPLSAIAVSISIAMFFVMLFFVYLFISQLIRKNRTEIGILRALGFLPKEISSLYCTAVFIISLLSAAFGISAGIGLTYILLFLYCSVLGIPTMVLNVSLYTLIAVSVLLLITAQIGTLINIFMISRILPAEAMRAKSSYNTDAPAWIKVLLRPIPEDRKLFIFSAFRNKFRYIASILCIVIVMQLIFTSISFYNSESNILSELFDRRLIFDTQVFFDESIESDTMDVVRKSENIGAFEEVFCSEAIISFKGESENVIINAIEQYGRQINILGEDRTIIELPQYGMVIDAHTAAKLGIEKGDVINISITSGRFTGSANVNVNEICAESAIFTQYCSLTQMKRILDVPDVTNSLALSFKNDTAKADFLAQISKHKDFSNIVYSNMQRFEAQRVFTLYDVIILLIVLFSFIIGFILIYNMSQMSISERQHEFALLRTFGFSVRSLSLNSLSEETFKLIISLIIGTPICMNLTPLMLSAMNTDIIAYPFIDSWITYIISVCVMFIFVIIGHFSAMRKVKNINIAEGIKERD